MNIEINRTKIGKRLADLREARNERQSDVARLVGLSRAQVWQIERGESLTLEHLAKMAKFYRVSLDEIIF